MPHEHHAHEHHEGHSSTREKFLERLKDQGFKLTGKRKSIVEILLEEDRYISARDLMARMQEQFPRLSFDTVYRNLHILKEEGLVEESTFGDGGSKFRVACDGHDHHHHYICTICGKTQMVADCPMDILEVSAPPGFHIETHRFEIFGHCADCCRNE